MAQYVRRDFAGGAVSTTIIGSITAVDTVINIADATGWPAGTNGPFFAVISRGVGSSEEKILVLSRVGTQLTLNSASDRGVDGTTAQSHSAPETIEHCTTAQDADEANLAVSQLIAPVAAKGDLLTGSSTANRYSRTGVGGDGTLLIADSSQNGGVRWDVLPDDSINNPTMISDGTITLAKIVWGSYGRLSLVGQTPTVAHNALVALGFQTTDYDTDGLFTSSTTFTCPTGGDGLWRFEGGVSWPEDSTNVSRRYCALKKNASLTFAEDSRASVGVAGVGTVTQCDGEYLMSVGDTVQVMVRQDSGGTLTLPSSAASFFTATFVRPT